MRERISSRSSSSVSNSEADWANSSSSAGSSFSRTSFTFTAKVAVFPATSSGWWSSGKVTWISVSSPADFPDRPWLNSGIRPSEPSSTVKPLPLEPSNGSPSIAPSKSITTTSRSAAGRSTGLRLPNPSRRRSSSSEIASSGTSTSVLPTSSPRYSPSSAFGRTPTSIEKTSSSPSPGSCSTSSFGSPTVGRPDSTIARSYHSGSESRIACSSTASRPMRWMTSCGGTLPLRKPGSFISPAICFAARSTRCASTLRLDPDLEPRARLGKLGYFGPHLRLSLLRAHEPAAAPRSPANAATRPSGPVTTHAARRS